MRYKDFDAFAEAHPKLGELLSNDRIVDGNKFLKSMAHKARERGNFTPRMLEALRSFVNDAPPVEDAPDVGDVVAVDVVICALEQKESQKSSGALINMYRFKQTDSGWAGRLESDDNGLEDYFADMGYRFPEQPEMRIATDDVQLTITAKVVWRSQNKRYVILSELECWGNDWEDHSDLADSSEPEVEAKAAPEPILFEDAEGETVVVSASDDWRKALGGAP